MPDPFYSETATGPIARTKDEIDERAWRALRTLIERHLATSGFAVAFPETCLDSNTVVCGTNAAAFVAEIEGLVPGFHWHPVVEGFSSKERLPTTVQALDVLQACHRFVAQPIQGKWHSYGGHYHLTFDPPTGQASFRDDVNEKLARNGLVYIMRDDGSIERLALPARGSHRRDVRHGRWETR